MSVVGFIDNSGDKWSFEQALYGLNSEKLFGYTRDILATMVGLNQRSKEVYTTGSISTTGILNCLRKTQLERIVPYYTHPKYLWASCRGTLFHTILTPGDLAAWVSEIRLYKFTGDPLPNCIYCKGAGWIKRVFNKSHIKDEPCACCSISGQIDGYDALTQTLYDKKSMGDNGLVYLKDGPKQPHVIQTNIYRWLLNGGYAFKLTSKEKRVIRLAGGSVTYPDRRMKKWYVVKLPVNRLVIQYFSMMSLVLTGGEMVQKTAYIKSEPAKHNNEIKREVIKSYLNGSNEMKQWELTYKIPEVPIMTESEVVSFVNAKKHDLVNALQTNTVAPKCDEDTQKWLCDFCGVKDLCLQMKDNEEINLEKYCSLNDLRLSKNGDKQRVKEITND